MLLTMTKSLSQNDLVRNQWGQVPGNKYEKIHTNVPQLRRDRVLINLKSKIPLRHVAATCCHSIHSTVPFLLPAPILQLVEVWLPSILLHIISLGKDPHLKFTAWFVLNVCQFHVIVELGLSVFLSCFFLNKKMPSQKPLIPLVQDDVLCVLISQSLSRACNYSHTWQSFQG